MRAMTKAGMTAVTAAVLVSAYAAGTHSGDDAVAAPVGGTGSSGSEPGSAGSAGSAGSPGSGTFTGKQVSTRWGTVQVQITVENGRITAATALQYPQDNRHDQEINAYALPILEQQAVAANSAQLDGVSGATVTTNGYVESLQSAIDAAGL